MTNDEGTRSVLFSVFTPTYNRMGELHRVYDSLCAQTCTEFEWIVIDDGSTDGTRTLVERWQAEAPFAIRYAWQPNQHKKVAFNHGVRLARGALFLPWDSDDAAVPEALDTLRRHWELIPTRQRDCFLGVCALCVTPQGALVGDPFPADVFDSTVQETTHRLRIRGDKWGFCRTDVLRRFPFPEDVPGHVPEGLVWYAIGREYLTRYVNERLMIVYPTTNSIMTASAAPGAAARQAAGFVRYTSAVLTHDLCWMRHDPGAFLRLAANDVRARLHLRTSGRPALASVTSIGGRLLQVIASPLGGLMFLRDRCRSRWAAGR